MLAINLFYFVFIHYCGLYVRWEEEEDLNGIFQYWYARCRLFIIMARCSVAELDPGPCPYKFQILIGRRSFLKENISHTEEELKDCIFHFFKLFKFLRGIKF